MAKDRPITEKKSKRGGARPGAGRKPKKQEVIVEQGTTRLVVAEKKPSRRGGARPGAGRKPKNKALRNVATVVVSEDVLAKETPPEKKVSKRGGARPGAGRKPKNQTTNTVATTMHTPTETEQIQTRELPVVKKVSKRGGARPGAGRKPKNKALRNVVAPVVVEKSKTRDAPQEKKVSKRGGARPGAGRKPKNKTLRNMVAPIVIENSKAREAPQEKKVSKRGGVRPGAGRKPKNKAIAPLVEQNVQDRNVLSQQRHHLRHEKAPIASVPLRATPTENSTKEKNTRTPKSPSKRGGSRPGAGRKPLRQARRVVFSIRLNRDRKKFCIRKGQRYFQNLVKDLMEPNTSKDDFSEVIFPSMRSSQKANIPFVRMDVPCGFPSPALDYQSDEINLHDYFIQRPEATILVRAEGESMTAAGIFDGDLLIVDRSVRARNNDIVLAYFDGQFTIKRFFKTEDNAIRLRPDSLNKDYPTLYPNINDFQIEGVITGIMRKLK